MKPWHAMLLSTAALMGCTTLTSIQPLVSDATAISEPRLLGNWTLVSGSDTSRFTVTQVSDARGRPLPFYTIRGVGERGDTGRFEARLGPLGRDSWVLELASDDESAWDRYMPFVAPTYMQLVVYRAASGLTFAAFNPDSLKEALVSHRLQTPYVLQRGQSDNVILTGDAAGVRAALASYAARPGALKPIKRNGYTLTLPDEP